MLAWSLSKMCLSAADKLEACDSALQHSRRIGTYMMEGDKRGKRGQEQQLQKICHDTNKVANEQIKGISTQVGVFVCWL